MRNSRSLHTLTRTQFLDHPIDQVFDFFRSPENLATITPPRLNFNMLTPAPFEMGKGTLIDYTIILLGVPVRWTSVISDYNPPYRFVDQQLKGPYSFWHHVHTFTEKDGGTEIVDEVRYLLPLGIVGRAVHAMLVRHQLKVIFDYRARMIAKRFLGAANQKCEV